MHLDPAEFDHLFRRWKATGDVALRNRLIEGNLAMVQQIAGRLQANLVEEVDANELASDGVLGLMDALKTFDPDRGCKFSTHANQRIVGAMYDGLRERDPVSRTSRQRQKHVKQAIERFRQEHGRTPDEEELREQLGYSPAMWRNVVKSLPREVGSLHDAVIEGEQRVLRMKDVVTGRTADAAVADDLAEVIEVTLREFGVTYALLLKLKLEGRNLVEIAQALRTTRGNILYRQWRLMNQLRTLLAPERLVA